MSAGRAGAAGAQVARGMAHLARWNFVHRDLAARNVLLAAGAVWKVADFGLSRAVHRSEGGDYYRSAGGMIPLRWTAVEAMATGRFTVASDVWSFGITMIEAYSFGAQPYGEMDAAAVIELVAAGMRHERPAACPEPVYEVLQTCWAADPDDRPGFNQLAAFLCFLPAK